MVPGGDRPTQTATPVLLPRLLATPGEQVSRASRRWRFGIGFMPGEASKDATWGLAAMKDDHSGQAGAVHVARIGEVHRVAAHRVGHLRVLRLRLVPAPVEISA